MSETTPFRYASADDSPGFLLWKVTALWQQQLGRVFENFGITQTQYALLASLRWFETQDQATTQTSLAAHARIEPMTLSKAIRRLEDDGLVARVASESDSRALVVRATTKGRRLTDRAVLAVEQADEEFFGRLNARALGAFKSTMIDLVALNAEPPG